MQVSEEILTYYMIYNCIMVRVFVVQITAYCMTIDNRRVADPEGDCPDQTQQRKKKDPDPTLNKKPD